MAALESAEQAVRTLREVPLLFVAAGAFGVLKLPVEVTRPLRITLDVYGALALLTFLVTPVLLAGLYGLAAAALAGSSSGDAFWTGMGDGYGNLVVANVAYAAVQHALTLVFSVVAVATFVLLAGGVGVLADAWTDPAAAERVADAAGALGVAGVVLVSLAYLLVRASVAFLLQLYKPAAAVGGRDPLGAFGESVRLVRANPGSTLAFVLVRYFATVLLVLPGALALAAVFVAEPGLGSDPGGATAGVALAAVAVVGFVVGVVVLAFLATYRVAFYRSLAGA